ncbi:MAG TPA: glycosyltransferase family 4 protein [Longimicrobiales bacterium]|nr:glycosyltransferase family 4 protein [Longimicrobiales bacterium]
MSPAPLHVVVAGPLEQRTGGYLYDAHMVAGLRELGWRVHVHNLSGRFPDSDTVAREAMSATLASLPDGARVVIDGLAMGGLPAPIEAHADRLRIVSLVHHPLAEETGLSDADRRRFAESERRALAPCVGVLVSSAFTARGLEAYGVPAARIRVVVPGTQPARPAAGPGPDAPPVLLCVASVTPRKGHDVLVASLERVRDLSWTCVCAGGLDRDPDHADSVLRRVAAAGLADRIDFVGERAGEALDELYHRASVFVLASHYEGYGMALAEALARGLPVVSTTGGAIPFTVPADAGILVEPGDVAAFADALRRLLGPNARVRTGLAAAARRHAGELPSWREAAETFALALDELTR